MSNPYLKEAEEIRKAIDTFAKNQTDEVLIDNKAAFPFWHAGMQVTAGQILRYGDDIYKCIQPHVTQDDWTPDKVPALFLKITPTGYEPWDPDKFYAKGAKVTHPASRKWVSNVDGNHWEPGAPGVYTWIEEFD